MQILYCRTILVSVTTHEHVAEAQDNIICFFSTKKIKLMTEGQSLNSYSFSDSLKQTVPLTIKGAVYFV